MGLSIKKDPYTSLSINVLQWQLLGLRRDNTLKMVVKMHNYISTSNAEVKGD